MNVRVRGGITVDKRTLEPQASEVIVHATTVMMRAFLGSDGMRSILAVVHERPLGSAHHVGYKEDTAV